MNFEWDKANRDHLTRHKISPEEAEQAFRNDPFDLETQTDDLDGYRYLQIGETLWAESW